MKLLNLITSPWAMYPPNYEEMVGIYLTHLRGEKIDIAAIEAKIGGPLPGVAQGYEVVDGVAIVPIDGILAKRMNMMMKVSGGTSLELLGRDFAQALADPAAHSILLQVDSPGGSVMGLQEVANAIHAARGVKPIVALTDGMMASAAYWLASAADAIYISSDTTMVGSIGVIYRHIDRSGADAKAGVKVTEVYAGKYKTMTSDAAPLSDAARADIQAKVDALYSLFVDTVARHRGVDAETVLETMAEGRVFLGKDAMKAGLVDGVSTLDALIRDMNAGVMKPLQRFSSPASAVALKLEPNAPQDAGVASAAATTLSSTTSGADMTINRDFLLANHADLVEAFRAEGFQRGAAEGRLAGAAAEFARIQAVEAQLIPGHEKLIATLKADGKTTGPEAAVQVLAAEKAIGAGRAAALAADGGAIQIPATPSALAQAAAAAEDDQLPVEDRCKAKWDKDPAVRAEFGDYATYLAFEKAHASGHVKILGRKAA